MTIYCLQNVAATLMSLNRASEALPYCEEGLKICQSMLPEDHSLTLGRLHDMGNVLRHLKRFEDALPYFQQALEGRRTNSNFGEKHPSTIESMNTMGAVLRELSRLEESEKILRQAIQTARAARPNDWQIGIILTDYGRTLIQQERFADAQEALEQALTILQPVDQDSGTLTKNVIDSLVDLHDRWHRAEPNGGHDNEAARWRAKRRSCSSKKSANRT